MMGEKAMMDILFTHHHCPHCTGITRRFYHPCEHRGAQALGSFDGHHDHVNRTHSLGSSTALLTECGPSCQFPSLSHFKNSFPKAIMEGRPHQLS